MQHSRNDFVVQRRLFLSVLLAVLAIFAVSAVAQDDGPPPVTEGSLLYRSPISNAYEAVPLIHTDVLLDVRGPVVAATVTQQYANSSNEPVEAVYVFPLPHDAAVYDMEIHIGNRVIRSVVKEKAEARRVYEAAKSEGKRAALLEQERPNIFTTSVANIMPGDKVDVRLQYIQPLRWEAGNLRLVFPMVVGPRYIPGTQAIGQSGTGWAPDTDAVPDASRITPPVRNPLSRPGHDISVTVDLDTGFDTASIKCISHDVKLTRLPDGRKRIQLASAATIPNRDFVLELQQAQTVRPETSLFLSRGNDGETHFLLTAYPPTVQPKGRMPVEMLYMIDISGSMAGTSIEQARKALLQALDRLRPEDRFMIVAFNDSYREFVPAPVAATSENVSAARRYVQKLEPCGGTEMLPALLHLMQEPSKPGFVRDIVLLTDGDLGNEEQIFSALQKNLGNARLYTIAIGSAPNSFLATKMAQYGRGTFTQISDVSEVQNQMTKLFETIDSPVLTDVKLSFEGVEVSDIYPERPPDLFLNQPILIFGRVSKGHAGKMHLAARSGDELYQATISFDTSQASFHPGISTLWARQRVEDMMDTWQKSDEAQRADIRSAVIAQAVRYHLVTRFTSLVAVEEVITNVGGQNKTVLVPTELPAGWQMDKVFGAPATGTADSFFEALGILLLAAGLITLYLTRRKRVLA